MLSPEERQELAENALEELATGLNRAAQTMKVPQDMNERTALGGRERWMDGMRDGRMVEL